MKLRYIKKHFLNVNNFILIFVVFLVSLAIMFSISIVTTFNLLRGELSNNNLKFRTFVIDGTPEALKKASAITHVKVIEDAIFNTEYTVDIAEFNNELNGVVTLMPLIYPGYLEILYGSKIKSETDLVCNDKFYPFEVEKKNNKIIFNKERFLLPENTLGKSIHVKAEDTDFSIDLSIVGFYNSSKNNSSLNTCYVSKNIYRQLKSKYSGGIAEVDQATGEVKISKQEYHGKVLIVDKYQNNNYVIQELQRLDLNYYVRGELNGEYINLITILPPLFIVIVMLVFIIILENFFYKKIKKKSKNYAILKSIGCSQKNIAKIDIIENLIVLICGFIIALIIYIQLFFFIKNIVFAEYIYDGVTISFSLFPGILTFVLVSVILIFLNKRIINKKLEKTIGEILS